MDLICVHPPPTHTAQPPRVPMWAWQRNKNSRRWRRLLVAAVVIQHGKQFTKLQLSDILYQTKSKRE